MTAGNGMQQASGAFPEGPWVGGGELWKWGWDGERDDPRQRSKSGPVPGADPKTQQGERQEDTQLAIAIV